MKRAFTLVELLCVMVILGVLASFLFPVLTSAKKSAVQAQAASNVRQVYLALNLYAADYDTGSGSLVQQGFPDLFYWNNPYWNDTRPSDFSPAAYQMMRKSPCGRHPENAELTYALHYDVDERPEFQQMFERVGDKLALVSDFNCTDHDASFNNPFEEKLLIIAYFNGSVKKIITKKYPYHYIWGKP